MGPSGSGKTTLLSMMGCILRPTAGEVRVDGRAASALPEGELPDIRRRYIGFVFQSFNLFPSLSTLENVELVLRLKGVPGKRINAHAAELLDRVGLAKRAHLYPADLSGGEKQRTALARALAGDPPILLADEPTANLDSRTGRDVLTLLRRLAAEAGMAVAIVSHDPKAEELADRVLVLEDGRVMH
jgi:putative ABC transport system ATP-binding protein